MPGCAAVGCNNRSEKGYTMKCFPRDPVLRNIWKQRVGRADWEPSNNSFLCHVHFESTQWVVSPSGKVKLKKGALPSIFTVTSTRKSPKKRQKLGAPPTDEEDLEEYEVEYLENDGPLILNMANQKTVPNIISVQTQNGASISGQILQNLKFISSEALRNLQNENIIIVADENNREIGKIINDNFLLLDSERGKENVEILQKTEKLPSSEIKVEVKEETPENGLSAHDYDEIERKLEEICHSENESDNDSSLNHKDSSQKVSNQSLETESTFNLDDLEDDSNSVQENSNHNIEVGNSSSIRTGIKRKRKIKVESPKQENFSKTSLGINKTSESQFDNDVANIINDLETENIIDHTVEKSRYVPTATGVSSSQKNCTSKPVIKNDIQLNFKNDVNNKGVQNNKSDFKMLRDPKSSSDLTAKLNIQGEVIEKLTTQLIMYKDMERKMQSLSQELHTKNKEIEILMQKGIAKKSQERRCNKIEMVDLKDASETDLRNRLDFLENNNKKLMKTVTLEGQNRRKLECQVKSRDNQIKELNWKLEKASKFLDRAEKNANNYRKKMLNMQSLIRRKKLLNKQSSIFDQFLVSHSNQNFPEKILRIALDIKKSCGTESYTKLLDYEFPLPTLKELHKYYPAEVENYESEEDRNVSNNSKEINLLNEDEVSAGDIKMENVEYLEPEFLEQEETITGTVQDIFNESSDYEDLNELKNHIMIELEDD